MSLLEKNYSFYSIPAMWLLTYYPVFRRSRVIDRAIGYDNVRARENLARMKEKKVDPQLIVRASRMNDAHLNGLENLPFWSIAVVVGSYAKLENRTLNLAAIAYLASRYLYNVVYINQKTQAQSYVRSSLWGFGVVTSFYLIITSAAKIAAETS